MRWGHETGLTKMPPSTAEERRSALGTCNPSMPAAPLTSWCIRPQKPSSCTGCRRHHMWGPLSRHRRRACSFEACRQGCRQRGPVAKNRCQGSMGGRGSVAEGG